MTKQIILTEQIDCEHLLGKFLEHDAYNYIVNEDCDVYKPLGPGESPHENNCLLKFRKNVFPKSITDPAYIGLREGASQSDNRGLAAGTHRDEFQIMPTDTGHGKRRWITKLEKAIINYFLAGSPISASGTDQLDDILRETPNEPLEGRGAAGGGNIKGGAIWIVKKTAEFDFTQWVETTRQLSRKERKQAAIEVRKLISDTSYGNSVYSGTAGYFDRYPRIPFCRETAWSAANPDLFQKGYPLFEAASKVFKDNFPIRWNGQNESVKQLKDTGWRIGNSVYTTITINKDFRTACHRDAGDLCETERINAPAGFSNLTVLSDGKNFDGMYLCMPEYKVCVDVKPGDLLLMDAHQIHGNVPLISSDEGFERISVVMYFRSSMINCSSVEQENLRRKFVYTRKDNKDHEEWHEGWNGVSAGMWETKEWSDYLSNNGFAEEAAKVSKSENVNVLDFL